MSEDEASTYQLTSQPLLDYKNPVYKDQSAGLLVLWHDEGVPIAAASFSERAGTQIFHEFTSLTAQPLRCLRHGKVYWTPRTTGLHQQRFEGVSPPQKSKSLRLVQMRNLASKVEVRKGGKLRLLRQPLYRYAAPDRGTIDGAIFAYVVSNDPEFLLMVTAHAPTESQEGTWTYSCARMSSSTISVGLDGREIWKVGSYWNNPRSRSDPYLEAFDRKVQ